MKSLAFRLPVLVLTFSLATTVFAQSGSHEDRSPFRTLNIPSPNAYRTGSGRPGHDYWQQRVDYSLRADVNTTLQVLDATGTVHYENRSPDALTYLWMHLDQNACSPSSITNQLRQPPLIFLDSVFDFSCQGFDGGISINTLAIAEVALDYTIYGATMRVDLPTALGPGESIDFSMAWTFNIPEYGMARMGRDGPLYEIAQWFPRVAVYDDVRGWNHEPYIGAGEFYLEYGSYDVSITLPSTYVVTATGELANPDDVLTATQISRLEEAAASGDVVAIIDKDEVGSSRITRPTTDGDLTWHFTADDVRDFAFAAGTSLRWDAVYWSGIRIETFYRSKATRWEEAIQMARSTIKYFSEQWFPYPYSHATTVEGPIEGMEYPMLTFVPDSPSREDLQWVVMHEFGHEWFPMVVGSNERFYPWMDEGFNTFIDLAEAAQYFEGTEYGETIEWNPLALYAENAIAGEEQPLITRPAEQTNLFWTAYQKPALMMQLLRHEVLGEARFDAAFREYISAWAYKHPTPSDFFRFMKDASGMDLDWFWRGWVMTAARLDQAVESVQGGDGEETRVVLTNLADMVMPVELSVTYDDGSSETIRLPVEMWNQGPRFTYRLSNAKQITSIEIDPRHRYPDGDRTNNSWAH